VKLWPHTNFLPSSARMLSTVTRIAAGQRAGGVCQTPLGPPEARIVTGARAGENLLHSPVRRADHRAGASIDFGSTLRERKVSCPISL
jgi:hypothetical protein